MISEYPFGSILRIILSVLLIIPFKSTHYIHVHNIRLGGLSLGLYTSEPNLLEKRRSNVA